MKRISVIVPVYNEEETIEIFYNEIYKHLPKNYDWTLLFVNDGSSDCFRLPGRKNSREHAFIQPEKRSGKINE